ncbi:28S ribosomal protein S27, mitochondrial-like [Limulus polyphemus]|uniref:28S ribosomal protein S27, mitochondrial-like n=1 Tax=Limulus polyphemus TaxID=6850 RepID=A0ABM1BMH7_LIMPO|nr:28S ribosomal protein S27, mitochondrial-like [Limulus polyphemus]
MAFIVELSRVRVLSLRYSGKFLLYRFQNFRHSSLRHLLSSSYYCEEAWKERLKSTVFKELNMEEYLAELDKKFSSKRKVSAVDIDLFANHVQEEEQLEHLESVIHRFRRTPNTLHMLESTPCAVIRAFLQFGHYDSLLKILNDRINYGIFPDYYCYNILMDVFLKKQNYRDAAKIASLMMLQEDFNHPISCILALYSCHMYLRDPQPEPWDTELGKEEETKEEDEEEVFIRVPYIRNPFYDDHFDIKDPKYLIGKTLYLAGKEHNSILGRTYQLVGLGMYEKWEKAEKLLSEFLNLLESQPVLLQEGVSKFRELLQANLDDETNERRQFKSSIESKLQTLESKGCVSSEDCHKLMNQMLEDVTKYEDDDIQGQKMLFKEWEQKRKVFLTQQIEEYLREKSVKAIEEKKKELSEKEELLFFFENWDKHEMELAEVEKLEEKQKGLKYEEEYIPPEIPRPKYQSN